MSLLKLYVTAVSSTISYFKFDLNYGEVSLNGSELSFIGSGKADKVYLNKGIFLDFTLMGRGADELYLTGSSSDYTYSILDDGSTIQLIGNESTGNQIIKILANTDKIIFSNGMIVTRDLKTAIESQTSNLSLDTSQVTADTDNFVSAEAEVTAYAESSKVVFSTMGPNVKLVAIGSGGADTVYVQDGASVDATKLGRGEDIVYFRGSWDDYTKTIDVDTKFITFTREMNGSTETIVVTGAAKDRITFSDGSVLTTNAFIALELDINATIDTVTEYDPDTVTMGVEIGDLPVLKLVDTGVSSSDKITNNGEIQVTNLKVGSTWKYSIDNGTTWIDGVDSKFTLEEGVYADVQVKEIDKDGIESEVVSLGAVTVDATAPNKLVANLIADTGTSTSDKITSNGEIEVTGIEAGSTWQYTTDGTTWIEGTGTSFTLEEGEYSNVQIRQTDAAGNESEIENLGTVIVDKTVLKVSSTNPVNGKVEVTGIEEGAVWQYTTDGTTWIDGTGTSFTLEDGTYADVQIKQIDIAGNESEVVSLGTVVVDTTVPDKLVAELTADTGISTSDKITNNGEIQVTNLKVGSTWKYSIDNGTTWIDGVDSKFTLEEGVYADVQVKEIDKDGIESEVVSLGAVTVDATAPNKLVANLIADTGTSTSDKITSNGEIEVTGIEAGSTWQYTTDGTTWIEGTGESFTLEEGEYSNVQIRQTDAAGNESEIENLGTVIVDATAPNKLVANLTADTGISTSDKITSNGEIEVTGIEAGAVWQYTTDGTTWIEGTGESFTLEDGTYVDVQIKQIDIAGNESEVISLGAVVVDTTAPDKLVANLTADTGISTSDKITNNGEIQVTGIEAGSIWEYTTNGVDWIEGTGESFTLEEGEYSNVQIRQTDAAGNESEIENLGTIIVDKTVAQSIIKTEGTIDTTSNLEMKFDEEITLGISGRITIYNKADDSVFEVLDLANVNGTMAVNNNTLIINPTNNLIAGNEYYIKIENGVVIDKAGNKSIGIDDNISWIFNAGETTSSINFNEGLYDNSYMNSELKENNTYAVNGKITTTNSNTNVEDLEITSMKFISSTGEEITVELTDIVYGTDSSEWSLNLESNKGNFDDNEKYTIEVTITNTISGESSISKLNFLTDFSVGKLEVSYVNTGIDTDNITNNGVISISNLEVGASWEYSIDGGVTWVQGIGKSFTLEEGVYEDNAIQVKQIDKAGNESEVVNLGAIEINTTAPDKLVAELTADTGNSDSDKITNNGEIEITGIEAGSTWQYTTDGTTWIEGTGTSFTLEEGEYSNVQIRQTDAAGNESEIENLGTVIVDKTVLKVSATNPVNGKVEVTGIEVGSTWQYTTDGTTWIDGTGESFTLEDGTYADVQIRQIDIAGNESEVISLGAVTVDTTAPDKLVANLTADTGISTSDKITNNGEIQVTGIEAGSIWEYTTNGVDWIEGTGESFTLEEGEYSNVQIRQTDAAGNESEIENLGTVIVDKIAPDKLSAELKNGVITLSDLEVGSTWQYTTNGVDWIEGTEESFTLEEGEYSNVQIKEIDKAGNESEILILGKIVIDTTPPAELTLELEDTGISNTDKITQNGEITVSNIEEGATWEYSLDGGNTWTQGEGTSFTLAEGKYLDGTVQVKQIDSSGNESTIVNLGETVIDTISPNVESNNIIVTNDIKSIKIPLNLGEDVDNISTVNLIIDGVSYEDLELDEEGNVVLTGEDSQTIKETFLSGQTTSTIQIIVIDKAGNETTTIEKEFILVENTNLLIKLEANGSTNGNDTASQITTLSDGTYVITYIGGEVGGADNSIYVQKFNADGTRFGSQTKLEATGSTDGSDTTPQVTALLDGGYVVTFSGPNNTGQPSVFVQKFNIDGTIAGSQVELEAEDTIKQPDITPEITTLSDGGYVVTYTGYDGVNNSIYIQRFSSTGGKIGEQAKIEVIDIAEEEGIEINPQITGLSDGGYTVTYQGKDSVDGDYSIYVQKYDVFGEKVGEQVKLEATGVENKADINPQITSLSDGGYAVTFSAGDAETNGDYSIYVQKFDADGKTSTQYPTKLEATDVTNAADKKPQITSLNDGSYVVTYEGEDSVSGETSIYVQKFNVDGTKAGEQVKLEGKDDSGNIITTGNDTEAQITGLSDGSYVVVYTGEETEGGETSIYVQKFNEDGTIDGEQVKLEAKDDEGNIITSGSDSSAQVTALEDGGYVVTFTGEETAGGESSIYVQRFSVTGERIDNISTIQGTDIADDIYGDDNVEDRITAGSGDDVITGGVGIDYFVYSSANDGNDVIKDFEVGTDRLDLREFISNYKPSNGLSSYISYENENGDVVLSIDKDGDSSTTDDLITVRLEGVTISSLDELAGSILMPELKEVIVSFQEDTGSSDTDKITSEGIIQVSNLEDGATWEYSLDGGNSWTQGEGTSFTLAEGKYEDGTVQVKQIDAIGNESKVTSLKETIIDAEAPIFEANNIVITSSVESITIPLNLDEDINNLSSVTINIDGIEYTDLPIDENGNVVLTGEDSKTLKDAFALDDTSSKTIDITVIDKAGNEATITKDIELVENESLESKLEADGNFGGNDKYSQIVALSNGSYVVTYVGTEVGGSESSIYVQKFNADGTRFGSQTKLEATDFAGGNDTTPQITALSDGSYVVTFSGLDNNGNTSIYVQKFTIDGEKDGTQVKLDATVVEGDDFNPQITSLNDGGYIVTYYGTDTSNNSIYIQRFSSKGEKFGDQVIVEATDIIKESDINPQITGLSDGGYTVTYQGKDSVDGDYSIYVQKYDLVGEKVGEQVKLEATGVENKADINPQITSLSDGGYAVTFSAEDAETNGDYSIYVQKFDADGKTSTQYPTKLEATDVTNAADKKPQITSLNDGSYVVTYEGEDSVSGETSIYVQKFNVDGTKAGEQVKLEGKDDSGNVITTGNDTEAQITGLSDGSYVVVYTGEETEGGETSIYVQKFNEDGTIDGEQVKLEAKDDEGNIITSGSDSSAQVTALEDGGYVVTFTGEETAGGESSIYVQRFDATGKKVDNISTIQGTEAKDYIYGDDGVEDYITAGSGDDEITGGVGRDYFVYSSVNDGNDVIKDFEVGTDRLDLREFISNYKPSNGLSSYISYENENGDVVLSIDKDGDSSTTDDLITVRLEGVTISSLDELAGSILMPDVLEVIVSFQEDTGTSDTDQITSKGIIQVSNLEDGATWEYSLDGGNSWTQGEGTSFTLAEGKYEDGTVQVKQIDAIGNESKVTSLKETIIDAEAPIFEANNIVITSSVESITIPLNLDEDINNLSSVTINIGGIEYTNLPIDENGNVVLTGEDSKTLKDAFALDDTSNKTIDITVIDKAGNEATITKDIELVENESLESKLEANGSTNGNDTASQITTLSDGTYVITYVGKEVSDGDSSIYLQRFNTDGTRFEDQIKLEAVDNQFGNDVSPQIAALSDGSYVVVFSGADDKGDTSIYVQKFNADGSKLLMPVKLEATGYIDGEDITPEITTLSDGGYVVTYTGYDGVNNSIYIQRFSSTGGKIGEQAKIEVIDIAEEEGIEINPQITGLSDGGYTVTYQGKDSVDGDYSIYVQKYDVFGEKVGEQVKLEATGVENKADINPQITSLSDGGYAVTFSAEDAETNGDYSIYVQKFDADGKTSTQYPTKLEATDVTNAADKKPQITSLNDGSYVVTYEGEDSVSGETSIYVQKFNVDGTIDGEQVKLEGKDDSGNVITTGNDTEAQITGLSDGSYVVVYTGEETEGGETSIYVQKFNEDGTIDGEQVKLEAKDDEGNIITSGSDSSAQVTALEDGGYVVTFTGEETAGGESSIYVQRFDATGKKVDNISTIQGTEAKDYIYGDDGVEDYITAGSGDDEITGGVGRDYFVYSSVNDGNDVIKDFEVGTDRLDLREFISNYKPSNGLSSYISYENENGDVVLTIDKDGDSSTTDDLITVRLEGVTISSLDELAGSILMPDVLEVIVSFQEDTGTSDTDQITSKGIIQVSNLEDGATWEYSLDGGNSWTQGEGTSFTLAEGKYEDGTVQVKQIDAIGNESKVTSLKETIIDAEAPIFEANNIVITSSVESITIPLNLDEDINNLSSVTINIGGIEYTNLPIDENGNVVLTGEDSKTLKDAFALDDTSNKTIDITVIDKAGNEATITKDIELVENENVITKIEAQENASGSDNSSQITTLSDGSYVITYYGIDGNGDNSVYVQKFNKNGTVATEEQSKLEANYAGGDDKTPQITGLNNGGYVVAYYGEESEDGDTSIYVQKFNADGSINGEQVKLEATGVLLGRDINPKITSLSDGGYVITYDGKTETDNYNVYVQKFDETGQVIGNQEVLETTVEKDNKYSEVTALDDGRYVVSYVGKNSSNVKYVNIQLFNADSTKSGDLIYLDNVITSSRPQITNLADGSFVVVYETSNGVVTQKFDGDGVQIGDSLLELDVETTSNKGSQIIALSDGGYVVVWQGRENTGDFSIYVQKVNVDGTKQEEIKLEAIDDSGNVITSKNDENPQVTALEDGSYVVTYEGIDENGDRTIYVQKFNEDGTIDGEQVKLEAKDNEGNIITSGSDSSAQVTALEDGGYVVTFTGEETAGGESSIYVQRFDATGKKVDNISTIQGTEAKDYIYGDDGVEDYITAGSGDDEITGGVGRDYFVYSSVNDGNDVIKDFEVGTDRLDLREFISNYKPSNGLSSYISYENENGDVVLTIDKDGDSSTTDDLITVRLEGVTISSLDELAGSILMPEVEDVLLGLKEDTGVSSIDKITNNSEIIVSGIIAGNTWSYSLDGGNSWTQGEGTSFTLAEGKYEDGTVQVKQIDAIGNESKVTSLKEILVDITAPTFEANNIVVTNSVDSIIIPLNIEEDINNLSSVTINIGGIEYTNLPIDENGNVVLTGEDSKTLKEAFALDDISNKTIEITVIDKAGNETAITKDIVLVENESVVTKLEAEGNTSGDDEKPQITSLSDGSYVVIYHGNEVNGENSEKSIYLQRFNIDGTKAGEQVKLEATENQNGNDLEPQITSLSDGGYAVVFKGIELEEGTSSVYVQKFNVAGDKIGEQVKLEGAKDSTGEEKEDSYPEVVALDDGGYIVVYQGIDSKENDYSIYIQRFNVNGTIVGDQVKLEPDGLTSFDDNRPQITVLSDGKYVVTYFGEEEAGGNTSVYVQMYQADGTPFGGQQKLEGIEGENGYDENPQIISLTDGGYVVVYAGQEAEAGEYSIFVVRYNNLNEKVGTQKLENSDNILGDAYSPQITGLSDGSYVVAYHGQDSGDDYSIYVQKFNVDGTIDGEQVKLEGKDDSGNVITTSNDTEAQITGLSDGGYVVTYEGIDENGDESVYVQKFDSSGAQVGEQVKLEATDDEGNVITSGADSSAQVAALENGEYVVTFTGEETAGGESSIYVQRFNAQGNRVDNISTIQGTEAKDYIYGDDGVEDKIIAGIGDDEITGGVGRDYFVYSSVNDGSDVIKDFEVGLDRLDLREFISEYKPSYGLSKYINYENVEVNGVNNVVLTIDQDGDASTTTDNIIVTLENVAKINNINDLANSILMPNPKSVILGFQEDTGTSDADQITNKGIIEVSNLENGAIWEYSLDGGLTWTQGVGTSFTLAEGKYLDGTVQVKQIDVLGNESKATILAETIVDIDAPTFEANNIVITSSVESITIPLNLEEDINNLSSVTIAINGKVYKDLPIDENGNVVLTGKNSETLKEAFTLNDISKQIEITLIDKAGNKTTITKDIVLVENENNISTIQGTEAKDYIYGDDGVEDYITAGSGDDEITGGVGRDYFVYSSVNDGNDVIKDFEVGTDRLDLREFISNYKPSNGLSSYISYENENGDVVLTIDKDGDSSTTDDLITVRLEGVTISSLDELAGSILMPELDDVVLDFQEDTGSSDTDKITSNGIIEVSALEDGATWEYSLDGGNSWTQGEGTSFTLAEGKYLAGTVQVKQIDSSGNESKITTLEETIIDAEAPIFEANNIVITSSVESITIPLNLEEDINNLSSVTINIDGIEYTNLPIDENGNVVLTGEDSKTLKDAFTLDDTSNKTIDITVIDKAGNETTITKDIVLVENENNTSTIQGTEAKDYIYGDDGVEDSITAESGDDVITGGVGKDYFVYTSVNDGNDVIKDFEVGTDRLDLSNFISNYKPSNELSNELSKYISYENVNGDVVLTIDKDGDSLTTDDIITVRLEGVTISSLDELAGSILMPEVDDVVLNFQEDTGSSDTDKITSNGIIEVSALEDGATWEYSLDGGNSWTQGVGTSFTLAEGKYLAGTVQVKQIDSSGNESTVTSLEETIIDAEAPIFEANNIVITSSVESITIPLNLEEDINNLSSVTINIDGIEYTDLPIDENGNVVLTGEDSKTLKEAFTLDDISNKTMEITVIDKAGNETTITKDIVLVENENIVTKLEANESTTGNDAGTKITTLSDGSYVITYYGRSGTVDSGDRSIYVQRFNPDGTKAGEQVKLEATDDSGNVITGKNDQTPEITSLSDGGYVVTYYGGDEDGDESIYVQKFNADGTKVGEQVKLEAIGNTTGKDYSEGITSLLNGEYVVAYSGKDGTGNSGDYSIYVQKFNADGTKDGEQVKLEATGNIDGDDFNPRITTLSNGSYIVTYYGIDENGDYSIYVQKFNADGTTAGGQVKLEATGVENKADINPQITSLSDGGYVVTYEGIDEDGDSSIYVQKFNADGTTAGNQVKLEAIGNTTGEDEKAQITSLNDGSYIVIYSGRDSDNDFSIYIQKFNVDGTKAGEQVKLEATDDSGNVITTDSDVRPQITSLTDGGYVVTYEGNDENGDRSIYVQKFNADGIKAGEQVKLEAIGVTDGVDESPEVTALEDGGYVVTFTGKETAGGESSIYVQRFDATGKKVDNISTIQGTEAKDYIYGDDGLEDYITAGSGDDVITGGVGIDIFIYTSINDGNDVIKDFEIGTDRLDLREFLDFEEGDDLSEYIVIDKFIKQEDEEVTNNLLLTIDKDGDSSTTNDIINITLENVGEISNEDNNDLLNYLNTSSLQVI
ncbi:type 1 secretion target domain protein [Arcobacter nitrofigilis DSM 7299]|uniref:Type 1 secretion target domain protein n=1 Tax=Arcobacter nitrofigilis (strain ATCC 33309 / DSM 7299 / CCUG 15893 / LMG 7604 / NCTC 12251 / CI) TaxID=572480 RepID=D5V5Z8_ARCNC|nr:Ig-like domain-containing protein [Arcobacter nitrofigilis]ADG93165.1 type 1 secretion target domain protein [Arcobacter nitrofigilis DSM 7299]